MSSTNFNNNNNDDKNNDNKDDSQYDGAACNEILIDELKTETQINTGFILPPIDEVSVTRDINVTDDLPPPPLLSSRPSVIPPPPTILPGLIHDMEQIQNSHRRYSYAINGNNQNSNFNINHRTPSMPSIFTSNNENDDINYKKITIYNGSRRSSNESAYHSHASGQSPRPPSSNMCDYQTNLNEELLQTNNEASLLEQIPSVNNTRRDSFSYDAIREYFLVNNPYRFGHINDNIENLMNTSCPEHNDNLNNESCPNCTWLRSVLIPRRRSSQFRTDAHRRVVQTQFEELLDIPDPRTSRSTSIDLFGDLDLSHLNIDHENNDEDNNKDDS